MMKKQSGNRELGSSMIEFCFTIPVLLVVAGSTVDIARYMRYQQITNFVSQETGSEIYQQCSDLTVYQKPTVNTAGTLTPDQQKTLAAIAMCAMRIQTSAQLVLNKSLGQSAVSSNVFRANLASASTSNTDCSAPIARIPIKASMQGVANIDWGGLGVEKPEDCDNFDDDPIRIRNEYRSRPDGSQLSGTTNTANLETSKLTFDDAKGLQVTLPSQRVVTLVTKQSMCTRGRVVAVEVGYDFEPIVKFLPGMIAKLDSDGNQREITVF